MLHANGKEDRIKKNAIWVISNLCHSNNHENLQNLMHMGILVLFRDKMNLKEDSTILNLVIEALESMAHYFDRFKKNNKNEFVEIMCDSGISSRLETLQSHESELIYKKINGIIEKYFECE